MTFVVEGYTREHSTVYKDDGRSHQWTYHRGSPCTYIGSDILWFLTDRDLDIEFNTRGRMFSFKAELEPVDGSFILRSITEVKMSEINYIAWPPGSKSLHGRPIYTDQEPAFDSLGRIIILFHPVDIHTPEGRGIYDITVENGAKVSFYLDTKYSKDIHGLIKCISEKKKCEFYAEYMYDKDGTYSIYQISLKPVSCDGIERWRS
jgi:hypothetical protein